MLKVFIYGSYKINKLYSCAKQDNILNKLNCLLDYNLILKYRVGLYILNIYSILILVLSKIYSILILVLSKILFNTDTGTFKNL